jgi:hypothetical protein
VTLTYTDYDAMFGKNLTVCSANMTDQLAPQPPMNRRVIVSRFQYVNGGRNPVLVQAPGEARFHCFSIHHEEYENGPGHYPAAVVEWPDGKVESVPVGHIQFIVPTVNPWNEAQAQHSAPLPQAGEVQP